MLPLTKRSISLCVPLCDVCTGFKKVRRNKPKSHFLFHIKAIIAIQNSLCKRFSPCDSIGSSSAWLSEAIHQLHLKWAVLWYVQQRKIFIKKFCKDDSTAVVYKLSKNELLNLMLLSFCYNASCWKQRKKKLALGKWRAKISTKHLWLSLQTLWEKIPLVF